MFNPLVVVIHSKNDYMIVMKHEQYLLENYMSFGNFKLYPPQIYIISMTLLNKNKTLIEVVKMNIFSMEYI